MPSRRHEPGVFMPEFYSERAAEVNIILAHERAAIPGEIRAPLPDRVEIRAAAPRAGRGIARRSPASDAASSLAPNAVRARATLAEFIGSSPTGITAGVNQEVWFLGTSRNRVDGTVVPRQEGRRFHSAGLVSSFRFCLQMRTWKPGDTIFAKERQSA